MMDVTFAAFTFAAFKNQALSPVTPPVTPIHSAANIATAPGSDTFDNGSPADSPLGRGEVLAGVQIKTQAGGSR